MRAHLITQLLQNMYDSAAPYYDAFFQSDDERIKKFKESITQQLKKIPISPGDQALDLGCGTGTGVFEFLRLFPEAHCTGLDLSPKMLRIAEAKARKRGLTERTCFKVGHAERLPFADHQFAAVFSLIAFHLMEKRDVVLAEIARVLKPEGRCFLLLFGEDENEQTFMKQTLPEILAKYLGPERAALQMAPWDPPSVSRMEELLTATGFTDYVLTSIHKPIVYQTFDEFYRPLEHEFGFWKTSLSPVILQAVKEDLKVVFATRVTADGYRSASHYLSVHATKG